MQGGRGLHLARHAKATANNSDVTSRPPRALELHRSATLAHIAIAVRGIIALNADVSALADPVAFGASLLSRCRHLRIPHGNRSAITNVEQTSELERRPGAWLSPIGDVLVHGGLQCWRTGKQRRIHAVVLSRDRDGVDTVFPQSQARAWSQEMLNDDALWTVLLCVTASSCKTVPTEARSTALCKVGRLESLDELGADVLLRLRPVEAGLLQIIRPGHRVRVDLVDQLHVTLWCVEPAPAASHFSRLWRPQFYEMLARERLDAHISINHLRTGCASRARSPILVRVGERLIQHGGDRRR